MSWAKQGRGGFSTSLLTELPAIVVVLKADGRIDYINPFLERLSGLELDEVRGRDWFDTFVPSRERNRVRALFRQGWEGREPTRGNVNPILTADGHERMIEWSDTTLPEGNEGERVLMAIGVDVTAREADRAMSAAELKRFKGLLDSLASYVGLFDLKGTVVEANRLPLEVSGLEREDVIGKPFWETWWWSWSPGAMKQLRNALAQAATGMTVRDEFLTRLRENEFTTLEIVFAPYRDEHDRIVGVVGSGVDVSERIRTRRELEESEMRFRSLVENAQDTFFRMSVPSGRFTYVSPSAAQTLGYDPDDFIEDPELIPRIIHPDSVDYFQREWANIRAGKVAPRLSYRIVDPVGGVRWIEQSSTAVPGKDGEIVALEGILRDVSEQHLIQDALRYNERRFRDLAEQSSDWLWELDSDLRVSFVATGRTEISSIDASDALGMPYSRLQPTGMSETRKAEWDAIHDRIKAQEAYRDMPLTICDPAGVIRHLLCNGRPIFDAAGNFNGYRGAANDITDRVESERAVAVSEKRFRGLVESGTMGILVYGLDHRPLYASPQAAAMLGYRSADDVLELASLDAILDDTEVERVAALRRRRMKGQRNPPVQEFLGRRKDGSPVWLLSQAADIDWDGQRAIMSTVVDITPQKLAERAHARSEDRLTQAQRIARVGSWEYDHARSRWLWSDELKHIFGFPRDTKLNEVEAFARAVHPEDKKQVFGSFTRAIETAAPFETRHRIVLPCGGVRWISAQGETLFDDSGAPLLTRGTMQDITESKEAAIAVEELADRLREAQRIGRLGSWELDIPSGQLSWSEENYRIREVEPGTTPPTYEEFLKTVHPDDRQRVRDLYETSVRQRQPYAAVHRLVMPDGRVKWVQQRAETLYGENGEPLKSRGTVQDITEQHQAEEAVRELVDRLNEAQRIARLGSWVLDIRTNRLAWSDEIFRIFEADPAETEVSYESFLSYLHPEDRDMVHQAYWDAVEQGKPYHLVHRILLSDGRVKWVEERGETVYGKDGAPQLTRGTVQDVTELRKAQAELESSLHEKEVLLREIHHRVKNNLQIISSLLYFQGQGLTDAKSVAGLQDIRNRLNAMVLVHERLYRSSDLAEVDFAEYATSLTAELARVYRSRNPDISLHVGGDAVLLPIEIALPLGMVVTELVSNAFKYAFPGGRAGRISVTFDSGDGTGEMVVSDDGVGLPEGLDPAQSESFGWRVVHALVEQIDGVLTTSAGTGVHVTVTFPLKECRR
jgi:PAS domain S-box-containing protein